MICPLCKNELAITASRTRADRDDRPDLATRVWVEQELRCRNRGCAGFGRVLRTARVYLIGGPDPGEETVSEGSLDERLDESLEEGPGGESAGPEESLDGSSGGENAGMDENLDGGSGEGPEESPDGEDAGLNDENAGPKEGPGGGSGEGPDENSGGGLNGGQSAGAGAAGAAAQPAGADGPGDAAESPADAEDNAEDSAAGDAAPDAAGPDKETAARPPKNTEEG